MLPKAKRQAELDKKQQEAEAKKLEEAKKKEEAEKARTEEAAKRKAEEEKKKQEAEAKKLEEAKKKEEAEKARARGGGQAQGRGGGKEEGGGGHTAWEFIQRLRLPAGFALARLNFKLSEASHVLARACNESDVVLTNAGPVQSSHR